MARSDRLLNLIQIMRRHRRPVTAAYLARQLEVSERTLYRDIASLVSDGVPIRGEAGIGYVLGPGYDLPPLMFTGEEVEALVVGMSWVGARGDAGLSAAAADVLAKVGAVLPAKVAPFLLEPIGQVPSCVRRTVPESIDLSELRSAIRACRKIHLDYVDEKGKRSSRLVWPLAIGYFELMRILVAWCETRKAFRHFRTDRMRRVAVTDARYPSDRSRLIRQWKKVQAAHTNGDPEGNAAGP